MLKWMLSMAIAAIPAAVSAQKPKPLPTTAQRSLAFSDVAACRAQLTEPEFDRLQNSVWYLPTADDATRLYIAEIGCGAPVLFLHGGPGNDFNYIVPALRPHVADHRFILLEQRGSLLSPVKPDGTATLSADRLVEDIEALRIALNVERMTIFGHSWGTLLALLYAERHPAHVDRLVLAAAFPASLPSGLSGLVAEMRPRQNALRTRPEVTAALAREGLDADEKNDSPRQASIRRRLAGNAALNVWHIDRWRQFLGSGVYYNPTVADAISGSLPPTFDFRGIYARLRRPVTIIQGDRDYIGPKAPTWEGEPGVNLITLRNAGHYGWIDDPTAFHRALALALRR